MAILDYLWKDMPSGKYVDGPERTDVVEYRQNVSLPAWLACKGGSLAEGKPGQTSLHSQQEHGYP
jgi:hypothetical protein